MSRYAGDFPAEGFWQARDEAFGLARELTAALIHLEHCDARDVRDLLGKACALVRSELPNVRLIPGNCDPAIYPCDPADWQGSYPLRKEPHPHEYPENPPQTISLPSSGRPR